MNDLTDYPYEFQSVDYKPLNKFSIFLNRFRQSYSHIKNKLNRFIHPVLDKISEFDRAPKLVRIASMEINLTAIWDVITTPFRFVGRLLVKVLDLGEKNYLQ